MNREDLAAALPLLFENSPDGHLLVAATGQVQHASPSARLLLNAEPADLEGTPLSRWFPSFEFHPGIPVPALETEAVSATGDRFPVEVVVVPAEPEVGGACWTVFRDVSVRRGLEGSVRRHAEELEVMVRARTRELDDLRTRYRHLYDVAPVLDFELDSQDAIASANRKACVSLGVVIDRLVGVPLADLALPEERAKLLDALAAMRAGSSAPFEVRLRGKDGVAIDVILHPLRPEPGPRPRMRVVGLDVTARREAERQVDQSLDLAEAQRARMECIVRGIGEGLVVTDPDGQVRLMNTRAERILAVDERFAFGRDLLSEQLDAEFVRRWSAFAGGDADAAEAELTTGGGDGRRYAAVFSRIRTREGRPAACAVVLRDVTAARRAETEMRELFAELVGELRGPLSSMRARQGSGDGSTSPGATDLERLAQLVEELLLFARLEAGRETSAVKPGDPADIVAQAVAAVEPQAVARGVAFTIRSEGRDLRARFDADHARRALELLLRRALRTAPANGRVGVALGTADGRVEITVTEAARTADADASRVRLERTSGTYRAQGAAPSLEIHLARRLVEGQGAELLVETGNGPAVYRLRLPGTPSAAAPTATTPAAATPAGSARPQFDPLEDEPDEALPSDAQGSGR